MAAQQEEESQQLSWNIGKKKVLSFFLFFFKSQKKSNTGTSANLTVDLYSLRYSKFH